MKKLLSRSSTGGSSDFNDAGKVPSTTATKSKGKKLLLRFSFKARTASPASVDGSEQGHPEDVQSTPWHCSRCGISAPEEQFLIISEKMTFGKLGFTLQKERQCLDRQECTDRVEEQGALLKTPDLMKLYNQPPVNSRRYNKKKRV